MQHDCLLFHNAAPSSTLNVFKSSFWQLITMKKSRHPPEPNYSPHNNKRVLSMRISHTEKEKKEKESGGERGRPCLIDDRGSEGDSVVSRASRGQGSQTSACRFFYTGFVGAAQTADGEAGQMLLDENGIFVP
ncbi:uncharacterized [Tachysurus ichikawai]